MASERQEVRTRLDANISKALIQKAVLCSDYSLCGDDKDPEWLANAPTLPALNLGVSCLTVREQKPKESTAPTECARRPLHQLSSPAQSSSDKPTTPVKRKGSVVHGMLTPPVTPGIEKMVVYDMTQGDDDIMEIWCDNQS
jgi:hypothetical protein